jgi:hypothetical protein
MFTHTSISNDRVGRGSIDIMIMPNISMVFGT